MATDFDVFKFTKTLLLQLIYFPSQTVAVCFRLVVFRPSSIRSDSNWVKKMVIVTTTVITIKCLTKDLPNRKVGLKTCPKIAYQSALEIGRVSLLLPRLNFGANQSQCLWQW